jgi:putative membrane protein
MLTFRKIAIAAALVSSAESFSPLMKSNSPIQQQQQQQSTQNYDPLNLASSEHSSIKSSESFSNKALWMGALATTSTVAAFPETAHAATAFTSNAIPSALAAYGHYLSIIGLVGCTMYERLTIKPGMSEEEEKALAVADIGLGIFGALITYTGYLRAVQFEKGWDFYSHEPIFWFKMTLLAVYGASTFFNTTIIIKRAVDMRSGDVAPMSEALATRMKKICNAGLVALALIPASATFVARGVGYSQDFPWQIECAFAVLVFGGAGFKYIKEALDFEEEPVVASSSD